MQIPLKWINELVDVESIDPTDLIERLTLGGFEVEEILELEIENEKQLALDISATANRSDSLSIQGISTEIVTLLNQSAKFPKYASNRFDWNERITRFSTIISDNSNCSAITAIILENLNNFTVPKWIQQKLLSSGILPVNNLLDFQNYILLETGYPFAFYDLGKIYSKLNSSDFTLSISKGNNNNQEIFLASNGLTYKLNSSHMLLKANDLTISILGLIENKEVSYSPKTTSLLIEGSIFSAVTMRQQSRSLGLRTNRSARYEKSLKNTFLVQSLYRLIFLLRISNPNLICKLHTNAQVNSVTLKTIRLQYQTINEILGPINESNQKDFAYIPIKTITNYLNCLNFTFVYHKTKLEWDVKVPDLRTEDITRQIDLIEEIGRLHGFNNFLTTLPKIKNIGKEDPINKTRKKLTSSFINLGLNELIHYSLVNEVTVKKNEVPLINPLLVDCSNLRSSLLPSLIKTVQENLKQGNGSIEGFEYGHVFSSKSGKKFSEKEQIAGIFGGIQTKLTWSESKTPLTWFEGKGKIEQLLKQLNLPIYWKKISLKNEKVLHPYRSAEIFLSKNQKLGVFGQIHPILANELNLSKNIYLFEFDLEMIQNQIQINKLRIYKEYSLYPKIVKDLSFIIKEDISFKKLKTVLYYNGTQFLSKINLLDEYQGKLVPDKHKSLCLELIFQSNEKTLENKKIETIISNLQLILIDKFKASIRN
jgi:phenylalanyl-tRNA synthetase beta chain